MDIPRESDADERKGPRYAALVEDDADDWAAFEGYVDAGVAAGDANDVLAKLDATTSDGRGPRLASLKLLALTGDVEGLKARVAAYVEARGASPSCFDDLEPSLVALGAAASTAIPEETDATARTISQMRRFCGVAVDAAACVAKANDSSLDDATRSDWAVLAAAALGDGDEADLMDAAAVLADARGRDEANAQVALASDPGGRRKRPFKMRHTNRACS